MTHILSLLRLLAVLLLFSGCSFFPEKQPPFTAAEADKYVVDTRAVMDVAKQAMLTLGTKDYEEGVRSVTEAQNAMVLKLGWDHERYMYIHRHFYDALSHECLRLNVEDWKEEAVTSSNDSRRKELRGKIEEAQSTLQAMRKRIERRTTVAERVLIHERLNKLARGFEGGIRSFSTVM